MVKCSSHNLQFFIGLQLNKVIFHLSISINPICTKIDLTHLSIFGVGKQILQLGCQDGETCGVLQKPNLNRRFHPIEVHLCLNQKLRKRHCKMFFLTTHDSYLYNFGFILDHTKWLIHSKSYKNVCKIVIVENLHYQKFCMVKISGITLYFLKYR